MTKNKVDNSTEKRPERRQKSQQQSAECRWKGPARISQKNPARDKIRNWLCVNPSPFTLTPSPPLSFSSSPSISPSFHFFSQSFSHSHLPSSSFSPSFHFFALSFSQSNLPSYSFSPFFSSSPSLSLSLFPTV